MRAAIFRNGDFVVDDIRDPTPSEGQVLVKSLCCGICGSDLHAAKHTSEFVDRSRRSGNRWVWIRNVMSYSGMSFAAKWWIMVRARTSDLSLALWSARCR